MPEKVASGEGPTFFEKPEEKTFCEGIGLFFYNPKTGAFLTRTPLSWVKILTFYCIFYSALACMFSGLLYLLLNSLDPRAPRWQLSESCIGSNPGLGFRPGNSKYAFGHKLLVVNTQFNTQRQLIKDLNEFLRPYQEALGPHYDVCDYKRDPTNRSVSSCILDIGEWEPCTARSAYGYNSASPCVFLKLNKVYAWEPIFYNVSQLPDDMPKDLQQHILDISEIEPSKLRTIWLSCDGETAADREHLGPVQYIPERGFPGYFYPYVHTQGYLSPLVAVYFERPRAGVIVSVECRAWAQNIFFNRRESMGSVTFQLFVQ